MPRDYADSAKHSKKSGQLPGWIWMLGGLIIGLFVAFLVYLNKTTPPELKSGLSKTIDKTVKEVRDANQDNGKPASPADDKSKPTANAKPAPKFDFYYILPELEVAVPEQELNKPPEHKTLDPQTDYLLQAASFKSHDEADRLKAKLALQGIEANIQQVTINNDTWHRVRIGPIRDVTTLNKTRKRLQENGINAIVVKAK